MRLRASLPVLLAVAIAASAAACGGVRARPPPATPAAAPPLAEPPAGRVLAPAAARRAPRPADPFRAALPGRRVLVLDPRARVLRLRDTSTGRTLATAPAGAGPTHVVARGGVAWVVDTRLEALLVYATAPRLEPTRRLYLPGSPYGIALDAARGRLWVALSARNRLAELPAHGRPHVLRELPTVRGPRGVVTTAGAAGPVFVRAGATVQAVDPDRVEDR